VDTDLSQFRNRIQLTNTFWRFTYGIDQKYNGEDPGITEKWFENGIPPGDHKLKVYVPSSWNYYQNRKNFYHFGTGWYENTFYLPEAWGSGQKKVTLVFGGANYKTSVWLNGQFVGSHEGGYTKFWFEVNDFVKFGMDNLLIIQVDNRYQENRIPWFQSPDWMNYGGIYRQVYLKLTPQVCIDDFQITNHIKYDRPIGKGYNKADADLRLRFLIKDFRNYQTNFEGFMVVTLKNSKDSMTTEHPVKLSSYGEDFIDVNFNVSDCHLWSPDYPYLYNITFQLLDKNRKELDREHWRWGFRDIKIDGNQFYLNNRLLILRGINYHEDHPDVGNSLNPRLSYNDLNIMKDMNVNFIRMSHYPPYESFIEIADEMGFLIMNEIPLWHMKEAQYSTPYLINAQKQLWEMIHRDKNHTSVFAWSIANESDTDTPVCREFMKCLLDIARDLDPTRFHTLVPNNPMTDLTMDLVDFVCVNMFTGWYSDYDIKPKEVIPQLEKIWDRIQNNKEIKGIKPLVISEFGAEAIAGFKDYANAHWSENYQYNLIQDYMKYIMECGYISGAAVWHFQDFRCSPFSGFLNRPREYNNKGIVDAHRNPKVSLFVLQRLYEKWKKKEKVE
jgi:beta-glucuronidase